jgi:hypothetical protein
MSGQSGRKKVRTFISWQERREIQASRGHLSKALFTFFKLLSGSSYMREWSGDQRGRSHTEEMGKVQGLAGDTRDASHVGAELEKKEEEGHHQGSHQDVMEEPRSGICQTRRVKGYPAPGPGQEGGPFPKLVHT